jgi:RNA polymerase sigma factor (sigma-70 family)
VAPIRLALVSAVTATWSGAGEGEQLWFLGTLAIVRVSGEASDGRFALIEFLFPRNASPPLHTHPQDESYIVQTGRLTLQAGEQRFELVAGAAAANLPLQQAQDVRAAAQTSASLDQPVGDGSDAVFGDFFASGEPLPEEQAELTLRSQALTQSLTALPTRARLVLVLHYGLGGVEPQTLDQIGGRLGLTHEGVRQIELESLSRLATLPEMEALASEDSEHRSLAGNRDTNRSSSAA